MTYHVVTASPTGSVHSFPFFFAIGDPMACPDPSSATALIADAPWMPRSLTVPATGSTSDGDSPWLAERVLASFHLKFVLLTRDPAVSSSLADCAIPLPSID